MRIEKPNVLAAECQTDTFKSRISFDDLLKSSLRWRPDRIILGEVRGTEARTLLDSFNTGHAGSLATIHANSAEKALHRFANLVMRSHSQTHSPIPKLKSERPSISWSTSSASRVAELSAKFWPFAAMTVTQSDS